MNLDEIKKRLIKMKALANAGVGGERANAEKLLEEPRKKTAPAEGSGCGDCGAEIA